MKIVKVGKDLFLTPERDGEKVWIEKRFKGRKSRTFKARCTQRGSEDVLQLRLVPEKPKETKADAE
jgi:hypothetical protein